MQAAYMDIMDMERPVHRGDRFFYRHPNMPIGQRAKIFAPYDALAGFSGEVKAKEIPYEPRRVPDADELWELNRRLNRLRALTFNRQAVRLRGAIRALYRPTPRGVRHPRAVCDGQRHGSAGRSRGEVAVGGRRGHPL